MEETIRRWFVEHGGFGFLEVKWVATADSDNLVF
jgi:hypothetical protein